MKNATESSTQRPTRSEAAPQRQNREMPLLFQLADVNRQLEASHAPAAAPAPVEMPALPGQFAASSFPLASSLFTSGQLNPWPAPNGLFETSTSFSTSALSLGSTESTKDSASKLEVPVQPAPPSGLPAVIEAAVKAAAALNEPAEVKVEIKPEPVATPTVEPKAEANAESPVEPTPLKTTPQVEVIVARSKPTPPAGETSAAPTSVAEPAAEKPAETTTAAATADKPSPASLRRQRAEARQQKVTSGKGGDWLQTHGKIIAIGFVIALVATIYLARRNRSTDGSPPSIDPAAGLAVEIPGENHPHPAHERTPIEVANTAPKLTEPPSNPHDAAPSPANTEPAGSPSNTAELQPPVVPSTTQPTTAPTSEPLFPWQNDSRAAAASQNPATVQPAMQPTPTPNTAPALNAPTYPETNLRDAPLLPPAPPVSPAPASGSAPAPSGGRGPVSTARSYPASFTSAPDGNRYERTGSGLY